MMTARSSSIRFSSSSVAMPSRPGIMMSTMAASNGSARASSSPSAPEEASAHVVALAGQQRLEDLAHDLLVVDDEDRAVVVKWPWSSSPGARARRGRRQRQRQREARALPDRAVAVNRAVVLADDAVGDRQAEAGAAADRLRREERIVDARELLGRNARPGVGDLGDRPDRRRRAWSPTASRRAASRRAR